MNTDAKLLKKHYGNVVEGPMGLAMPERLAREIEDLAKSEGLPTDFTYRRVAKAPVEFRVEAGERADVSFITTDAVDREGEVVLPTGGSWKNYNRVVTFAHQYDALPVGTNLWIKPQETKSGSGLVAKTRYPEKPADWGDAPWMPSAILHLMRQDEPTCTGKRIGFLPMNFREASKKEIEARPEWNGKLMIDKWVGIEYAVAPVPCNATAEMVSVGKCADVDDAAKALILAAYQKIAPAAEPAPAPVIITPFVRPETIALAIRRHVESEMKNIPTAVQRQVADLLDRAMGRI